MKEIVLVLAFLVVSFVPRAQELDSSSTKRLVPVESLISKIKPDTSHIPIPDSLKVDTVYVDNPMNVLKVGLDATSAFGFASICYERVLWFQGSAQIKVELIGKYNPFGSLGFIKEAYDNTERVGGIGLVPEFRYHGTEKYAPLGLFVGVYFPIRFGKMDAVPVLDKGAKYTIPSTDLSYSLLGVGFDLGYQHIFNKRLSIEALAGLSIAKATFSERFYTYRYKDLRGFDLESKRAVKDGWMGNSFYPRMEVTVGWAF